MIEVKICGINEEKHLKTCFEFGADYVGFVFCKNSKRNINLNNAIYLSRKFSNRIKYVGLFVNPEDKFLEKVVENVKLDYLQLHGCETIERIEEIKTKFNFPIIKALGISTKQDLFKLKDYEFVSDILLLDYKSTNIHLPGGSGNSFDWSILKNLKTKTPWMLAGGLNPKNVQNAIKISKANKVDVSSGVEENNSKSVEKIKSFLLSAKGIKNE